MIFRNLNLLAALLICWSCSPEKKNSTLTTDKYNIVWIVLEDQSPDFFPMYGDSSISLQAIESLAKESIIYDNAFANVPVCAPARSTILLGMYTVSTGTHNMRTFNAYNPDGEPTINVPSYTPVMKKGVVEFPKYLRAEGYFCTNNAKEDYNLKHTDGTWDESSIKANWRKRKENQAFFSIFNYGFCHESGIWRFGKDSLFVDPKEVKVPPYFPDNEIVRHDIAVNYSNLKRVDRQIAETINQLKEDGLYDNTYIFFYGDHGGPFPRHKRSLYDSGIKVPFFVKLPKALQNENTPSRNSDIISFIDLAPTALSIANIKKPEHMQGKAFLGSQLGEKDEYVLATSDRFDAVYDRKRAIRSKHYKYIKNYKPEVPYALPVAYREQMPMMQNLRALDESGSLEGASTLWMRDKKDPEEFFDIIADTYELNNLITEEKHASEINKMRTALNSWLTDLGDYGATDEQELIANWSAIKSSTTLEPPKIEEKNGNIALKNPNELGNIIYKQAKDTTWNVYVSPLSKKGELEFKIVHIGLDDSQIVKSN